KRVAVNTYAVSVSPSDGSVWGTVVGYPGQIVRVQPGPHPTETALSEVYEVPLPGFGPRGSDVDSNGVFWVSLASGHLASFDRRIDDPNAGWKGKALWSTSGTRTMLHLEGGKENRPKAARFQLRPNPLAR